MIDTQVFGEPASRMAGAAWDHSDELAYAALAEAGADRITVASDADQAAFAAISEQVIAGVLAELEAAGIDAQAAYDMVRAEMAAN
ncbi:hypothetical protein [Pararhodobacter sp.]